ncbi:hypothetical protein CathTA2_2858 [Caldalkalibacillus thermarum TA2.A1]|uniref:Uncharacterized protein n=1 Tax=Caldalkalibacillus thermarum (strain TA2.A1) TaxID=986075 RepID=F5LAC3_CALTT|nr:hypothetical protein [Caldalkalibacillus thermarum]EGL81672.1 hypothetical protein CathTA2_2858 [Caldalkalibacillus thermarum TA2.A1]QZT33267.1 hypothetical protein HUR95_13355 [Caldalkalibacillus thermarum TA2.A1]
MKIYKCSGFEYEKALPTTMEDQFNESEVVYDHLGEKRTLTVTYVRYFDTYVQEKGIYDPEQTGIPFYHLVALLVLMKYHGFVNAQRLYFNDTKKFLNAFNQEDIEEAVSIYRSLQQSEPLAEANHSETMS